jgi:hypothetical protein
MEAPLEHVADKSMPTIESLAIDAIDVTHQPRQVRPLRLQDEVVVVAHQAEGEHQRIAALQALVDDRQQRLPIGVVGKDALAAIAAGGDVVGRAGELDAKRAGHEASDRWGMGL